MATATKSRKLSAPQRRKPGRPAKPIDLEALAILVEEARIAAAQATETARACNYDNPELWFRVTVKTLAWEKLLARFDAAVEAHVRRTGALNYYWINRGFRTQIPVPPGGPREMSKADVCNVELLVKRDTDRWTIADEVGPVEPAKPSRRKRSA
jgi:hypothetical protein